ncbi:hypothetical protein D3C73_962220 [compost metagenome]
MRLTRPEETADPYAHAVGDGGIVQVSTVGLEEAAEVFFQLVGDNVLIQLLVHGCVVGLIRLNHAVDRAIEFLEENIFNAHGNRPYLSGNQLEGAVVVVAGNAVEQGE